METIEDLQSNQVVTKPPKGFGPPQSDQELEASLVENGLDAAEREKRALAEDRLDEAPEPAPSRKRRPSRPKASAEDWREQLAGTARQVKRKSRLLARTTKDAVRDNSRNAVDYFRTHSVNEMAGDVRSASKQHPILVFGSMALAGLALVRLLRK